MTERTPFEEIESVYRAEGPSMWRSLVLYCGDREYASDAVAEAFAQALRRGAELRDPRLWIWKTAYRVAAGQLKDRAPHVVLRGEESYDLSDTSVILDEAMRRLSPMQRASLVLHDYIGYKLREVAEITGSTPAAVGVHLSRARRKMRRLLEVESDA